MENNIKNDVKTLWDYLSLQEEDKKAQCIIGLGSILQIVPEKCAKLYKDGYGEYMIFSGNCGKGTEGVINKTEAEIFRDCASSLGVPEENIWLEKDATNTYENFKYIKEVFESNNISPQSFLIVGKPYQERRARAIAEVQFEGKNFSISSFKMSLEEFLDYVLEKQFMTEDDVINELVAEININLIAPSYGLQAYEEIPESVLQSYKRLLDSGYNRYVVNDEMIDKVIRSWQNRGLY